MRIYRRRMPYMDAPGLPVFVTWRLFGSLPPERAFPNEDLSTGEAFAAFDRLLDNAREGPMHLRRPEIARLVCDSLAHPACTLHAYTVMPNHVHVLWTPSISLATLIGKVKGATAHAANLVLGTTGKPFWQADYFDRLVQTAEAFVKIQHYIEWNPVKAGLVARPEDFEWSSAHVHGGWASSPHGASAPSLQKRA
jgi:REP element-mobilizing transposase RayT